MKKCILSLLVPLLVLTMGCGEDPLEPDPSRAEVVGSYAATTMTATTAEGSEDLLSAGSSIAIDLAVDGSTAGHLTLVFGSETFDADLTGTWEYDPKNRIVSLSHSADTFLSDMLLQAEEVNGRVRLEATDEFSGVTVHIILTAQ